MFLIVGLGNPGTEYAATRHNIGFDMVTYLSDKYGIALRSKEGKAIVGKGVIEGQKVMLVQPQTYMNLSGESVCALMDYYKLTTDEIVIIYDDISMPVGQVRIRPQINSARALLSQRINIYNPAPYRKFAFTFHLGNICISHCGKFMLHLF